MNPTTDYDQTLFDPPTFKGCPPICKETRLPAFDSIDDAMAFHERVAPGSHIYRLGRCESCKKIHYLSKMRE